MDDNTFFQAVFEFLQHKQEPKVERSPVPPLMELLSTFQPSQTKETHAESKEMPESLQMLIQDFARPVCRVDWRTCKLDESRAIYLCQRDKRHAVSDFIGGPEFWDIVVAQSFYELLKNYPPGPGSEEGQTTIQLRRVWV